MEVLRDGTIVNDRRLDRLVHFDPKSKDYPIRTLFKEGLAPKTQLWDCNKVLDQGNAGKCVGMGCTHELIATPVPILGLDEKFATEQVYWPAQKIDPWPGGSYPGAKPFYEGTDVVSGLNILMKLGYGNFRWSFTHMDTQLGISWDGPGIAGTSWMTGMMDVDSDGYIHATGQDEGGHCYLYLGIDIKMRAFIIHNSWGQSWGRVGRAFISFDDYEKLRSNQGEMAFLVDRKDPGATPPEPEPDDDEDGNWCSNLFGKVARLNQRR